MSSDEHAALLDGLWQRFGHIARARVDGLQASAALLRAGTSLAQEVCAAARGECHKLIGSLDSYGRTGGSALAARAEDLFAQVENGTDPEAADDLDGVLLELRVLVDSQASTGAAGPGPCVCAGCGHVHVRPEGSIGG